jgi:hypothetical protein
VSGYRRRTDPRSGKRYAQHRAIAEWRLGRPLEPGEIVHHCDEDRENDHPDNLRVLRDQSLHMVLHWYLRREGRGVQHLWPLEEWLELRETK